MDELALLGTAWGGPLHSCETFVYPRKNICVPQMFDRWLEILGTSSSCPCAAREACELAKEAAKDAVATWLAGMA